MLPKAHRLRSPDQFSATVRSGVRSGRKTVVAHMTPPFEPPLRVGFVVSKAVGNAVTRNLVKRRLRGIVAGLIGDGTAPDAGFLVLRALPASASASFVSLSDDVCSVVRSAATKALRVSQPGVVN